MHPGFRGKHARRVLGIFTSPHSSQPLLPLVDPISTDQAPAPAGHYSQGIAHGQLIYVSGQLPIDPATGAKSQGSLAEQTRLVLQNVDAILRAGGSSLQHTLKLTVYISDIAHWDEVNRVYAEMLGEHKPARAIVPTRELHFGLGIEIDAVAAIP